MSLIQEVATKVLRATTAETFNDGSEILVLEPCPASRTLPIYPFQSPYLRNTVHRHKASIRRLTKQTVMRYSCDVGQDIKLYKATSALFILSTVFDRAVEKPLILWLSGTQIWQEMH